MASRMSMYSVASEGLSGPRGAGQQSSQVSTTTLLNAMHNIYLSAQPYQIDSGTSLVVNTWLTAAQPGADGRVGGIADEALVARAWEHARRRAEDGCIVLGSLHPSNPSVLRPVLYSFPHSIPGSVFKALDAVEPFLRCVTPYNPSAFRQVGLGVTLSLNLAGNLTAASIALTQGGIDTEKGLLKIPCESGHRAFDVFYYLLTSVSTPAEREFLNLKAPLHYSLLERSGTYDPPSYLPAADDSAAADDFRSALKDIGIKGSAHRDFISTLAGLLKLGNTLDYRCDEDTLEEICEDVSGLLGLEPEVLAHKLSTDDRIILIGGLYEALVDWVITRANETIASSMGRHGDDTCGSRTRTPGLGEDDGDTVCITVLEIPEPKLGRAIAMRDIFDDGQGINAEMKNDGVEVAPVGSSVLRETQTAIAENGPDLGIMEGLPGRDRQHLLEKREEILERVGFASDEDGFLKKLLFPVQNEGIKLGHNARLELSSVLNSSRVWYHLSIHPTDESPVSLAALPSITSAWSAGVVTRQLRLWRLPEWCNRRNKHRDFTADFDHDEFVQRYRALGCMEGRDGIESWVLERGWSNGEVFIGSERVWMREKAWWEAESMLDMMPMGAAFHPPSRGMGLSMSPVGHLGLPVSSMGRRNPSMASIGLEAGYSVIGSGYFGNRAVADGRSSGSLDRLIEKQRTFSQGNLSSVNLLRGQGAPSVAPTAMSGMRKKDGGDYGLGHKGDTHRDDIYYNADGEFIGLDPELAAGKKVEEEPMSSARRIWVGIVWSMTWWIPSFLLRYVGRMKRPDVRMAWREKLVLCIFILLLNVIIVFWIIWFGRLLCPNYDKAWTQEEVATHMGDSDFWVSIHGKVYDITKFWRLPHSDAALQTTPDLMMPFAGLNLDQYFQPPLALACPGLAIADTVKLLPNQTGELTVGMHSSGVGAQYADSSALSSPTWYRDKFHPKIKEFYKGDLVTNAEYVKAEGSLNNHMWFVYEKAIYDLTDYFHTTKIYGDNKLYTFLNSSITDLVRNAPGEDLTSSIKAILAEAKHNRTETANLLNTMNCIKNVMYVGKPDFRNSPRCQVNNYILLAFTIMICSVIAIKFLSALQFGSKRRPSPQDKFVICQVPAYTEGEESLRKALDSLTALQYDNKRKLICVICDGVIVGAGNDRPTPKIVLDILGVDPKVEPPALQFKSVGAGGEQLNYGKIYSGLYEFEGNVVPYLVVVKVGRQSEQGKNKPGNRGKRDSQILLMSFLNRVHHRAPMSPLELEMFHQINNIIGVNPELYEYLMMVDADTCVREDSLNRMVAACANDSKIAGICGETSLQNEERSWWTMIQVYEYYISHHLAKAFESLFGSVTCLPGCFSMYRLRTADRGKPLIISDDVIRDYSICKVDTLHKKNLLSLGEDRYLTTLMTKYFPYMSYKFIPDAFCQTAAPEQWSVLLSQRRRWINSTIHNLVELAWLKEMCGFCCFSMRFVVIIDLTGTIILPATCVYLGYLIYNVAAKEGQFPLISIVMIAAVYGLQALIFILKRQWQHIGWMIIYIIAFPIYSFILPIYSFWNQDNFSWGNTRIVIGESGKRQLVAVDDEGFDPRTIPLQRWDDYALANNLPSRRGVHSEKGFDASYEGNYEMDDIKSIYSSIRPSSVFTGLQGRGSIYAPAHSSGPFANPIQNVSHASQHFASPSQYFARPNAPYPDHPAHRQSVVSVSAGDHLTRINSPYQDAPLYNRASAANLRAQSPAGPSRLGMHSDKALSVDFSRGPGAGGAPDDLAIVEAIQAVLREVDLDTVTKKQVRVLVEQRLQTSLVGERRTFMDRQIDNELASM